MINEGADGMCGNMAAPPLPSQHLHGGEKSTQKGVDVVEMCTKL